MCAGLHDILNVDSPVQRRSKRPGCPRGRETDKESARISSQLEDRRRKGDSGKAWQILQQRIDKRQTTENDTISGIDKSPEAREVRAGMVKTMRKLKQAMEEARHDDNS